MHAVDVVATRGGRPIVLAEAKARRPRPEYSAILDRQLQSLSEVTGTRWIVLADPHTTRIYKRGATDAPVAELPTKDLLDAAHASDAPFVGESVLVLALGRWLRALQDRALPVPAGLEEFSRDVGNTDDVRTDFAVA